MHILIVNDDGPPSPHSSPYVHSLVRELQGAGHLVSVCLPHTQRSWIGKAHIIGQTVKPTYYRPPPPDAPAAGLASVPPSDSTNETRENDANSHGTTHTRPSTQPGTEEWILVDGTPASCVQIGLYHFFADRGPVDLVVSGPNYGRNTTAVFALSSGTLGGALEAAVCRRRAIALSYAFFTRNHDPVIIAAASRQSVRVIEALARQWPGDGSVDLYSVNVPLLEGLEGGKVLYTGMLQNYWGDGSCFTEVDGSVDGGVEDEERIREGEGRPGEDKEGGGREGLHTHKHFKWSPRFTDVYRSVEEAPPGNDGWVVKEGHTSVTPLKANFWHTATQLHGTELQLPPMALPNRSANNTSISNGKPEAVANEKKPHLYALIDYGDTYVQPLILAAIKSLLQGSSNNNSNWSLSTPPSTTAEVSLASLVPDSNSNSKILQITEYEKIDFEYAAAHPHTSLVNSYMIRKALIRKHFLSATVESWVAKHPSSVLRTHVKRSEAFEVDYAEFLDDALVEAFDLRASLERNERIVMQEKGRGKEWWILKPSMSDRGQGIRLFSTMEELQGIFDGWEENMSDSEDEDEDDDEAGGGGGGDGDGDGDDDNDDGGTAVRSSHLRHFVAQPYIDAPLLLPALGNRKFHIRTYVVAIGSLRVYVYRDMLALFAAKPYQAPISVSPTATGEDGDGDGDGDEETNDLDAHLTNTCLQGDAGSVNNDSVHRFWDLPLADIDIGMAESIFGQICAITGDVFEAAARGMMVHFQPMENAFEVYGLDFLVDEGGQAWLLEVNAFPDFKQTGGDLSGVVAGFWTGVLRLAVAASAPTADGMVLVRDVDLGRRW
ncbi:survival protein sure-like phosphatase/nucleotidase [Bombardia bombarda]|uniref:Survival protein sure-like phosphatase/nucleotidase n=1 Tax=Bombardia bombarda TaxID=252184 RepID=A0AA40C8H1_9PEZI|nr:survival protein sure-like phosphatase/nucleotidase [Bombardia bombarda]